MRSVRLRWFRHLEGVRVSVRVILNVEAGAGRLGGECQ